MVQPRQRPLLDLMARVVGAMAWQKRFICRSHCCLTHMSNKTVTVLLSIHAMSVYEHEFQYMTLAGDSVEVSMWSTIVQFRLSLSGGGIDHGNW